MIVLRNLKAASKDEEYAEPSEHHHHVGVDIGGGAFRVVRLGSGGITIGDGAERVAIPLAELQRLAEPHLATAREARGKAATKQNGRQ